MNRQLFFALLVVLLPSSLFGQLKVGSLHPLMTDLVEQIGGDRVTVVEIGRPGFDVHTFSPKQQDLRALSSCDLVVASGKTIETYLPDLVDSLGAIPVLEVGETIPSRELSADGVSHACCPHDGHDHHAALDPHWWHDVKNMERAANVVSKKLAELDPENAGEYLANGKAVEKKYLALNSWVKSEISNIPRDQRKLVTAHAAFGYFCAAYNFEAVFVKGVGADHEVPAKTLAEEIGRLKKEKIRAIFPEKFLNPKVLQQIARETGAEIGKPLIADGSVASYEAMVRHNVEAIVAGLTR